MFYFYIVFSLFESIVITSYCQCLIWKQVQNGNENDTDGAADFFLSFFSQIMVVLNNKYVDMLNL
jgi:hypothetical protein